MQTKRLPDPLVNDDDLKTDQEDPDTHRLSLYLRAQIRTRALRNAETVQLEIDL